MQYPYKVIVKGKVYGSASTLAEAQSVANDRGGYVACECRHANPDLLTGKIRQREDGGHYVRTRKDKRPAEVDLTAEQVAGDWRTQLAHSGHAPVPKPPKAPKARAPKVAKPAAPAPVSPKTSAEIVAERFPNVSEARARTLAKAIDTGASESALEKLKTAARVEFSDRIALPKGSYDHLSRGMGWARKGRGNFAEWGENSPQGWLVGPGQWLVYSTDGFNRESEANWRVDHLRVGDETWTIASAS